MKIARKERGWERKRKIDRRVPERSRWPGEFLETDELLANNFPGRGFHDLRSRSLWWADTRSLYGRQSYLAFVKNLYFTNDVLHPSATYQGIAHALLFRSCTIFQLLFRPSLAAFFMHPPVLFKLHPCRSNVRIYMCTYFSRCLYWSRLILRISNSTRTGRTDGVPFEESSKYSKSRSDLRKRDLMCINAIQRVYVVKFARERATRIFGLHRMRKCLLLLPWEWEFPRRTRNLFNIAVRVHHGTAVPGGVLLGR